MIWMDFEFYVTLRMEFLPEFYCNRDFQAVVTQFDPYKFDAHMSIAYKFL